MSSKRADNDAPSDADDGIQVEIAGIEPVEHFRQIGIQVQQAGYTDLATSREQLGSGCDTSNYFGQLSDKAFFSKTTGQTPDAYACLMAAYNETKKRSGSKDIDVICIPINRTSDPDAATRISHGNVSRPIPETFSSQSFKRKSIWAGKYGSSSRESSRAPWMLGTPRVAREMVDKAAAARNTAGPQEIPAAVHPSRTFHSSKVTPKQTGATQSIKDSHIRHEDDPAQDHALTLHWPCAPEGVVDARSSGLICATVVARAMWSRLEPQYWPEPRPDEDAITTYTFADFREDQPGREEALLKIWGKAMESVTRQQRGETADDSFASICRSPGFVKAFWTNPRFQLTTPHCKTGWAYDERQVVLEGEDLARQAVVAWDGVEPATVEEAINSLTFKDIDDRKITTFAFFRSPQLLQVEFNPGESSKQSLADIQTFSTNKWEFVPDPDGMIGGVWKMTGQTSYKIMAIVLHRESKDDVDSVRLFRENGMEELPMGTLQIQWPFDLDEPIPAGSKITIFYESATADRKVFDSLLRPSERLPKPPLEVQKEIKARVGLVSVGKHGPMVEDTDREQLERNLSVFTQLAKSGWEQLRRRYKVAGSDAPDGDVALSEMPARRSGKFGPPETHLSRGKTSDSSLIGSRPDSSSMPPPHAPTEPRADREAKRPRENDENTRHHDFKRPRRSNQIQIPRRSTGTTVATGANAEGVSGNRLRPSESSQPGMDNRFDTRLDPNQQRPSYPSQYHRVRGVAERGGRSSSSRGGK